MCETLLGGKKMNTTEELKAEHGGILRMLEILQAVIGKKRSAREFSAEHIKQILEFLSVFVDKCHHGTYADRLDGSITAIASRFMQSSITRLNESNFAAHALFACSPWLDKNKKPT